MLNQICSQWRIVLRHRRATGNPWNFNDLIVQVQPNNATYQIVATDFAQPLAVLTHDPQNPSWIPRPVRIYEPQNLFVNLPQIPNQYASYAFLPVDGSNATAQRVAFYWRDNQAYVEFWPLPQLQAAYKVRYLQNGEGTTSAALTSIPLPIEDADLVELRAAIALLPLTSWWDEPTRENRTANADKRRELATTLANDEREARRQFEVSARQPTGPRVYERLNPSVG